MVYSCSWTNWPLLRVKGCDIIMIFFNDERYSFVKKFNNMFALLATYFNFPSKHVIFVTKCCNRVINGFFSQKPPGCAFRKNLRHELNIGRYFIGQWRKMKYRICIDHHLVNVCPIIMSLYCVSIQCLFGIKPLPEALLTYWAPRIKLR